MDIELASKEKYLNLGIINPTARLSIYIPNNKFIRGIYLKVDFKFFSKLVEDYSID